jgi:hypothetical protein
MNKTEIQTALDLHQKAYAFLLASRESGRAASAPLDEATIEAWSHGESCTEWVERHYAELPLAYRPERADVPAFAQLLTSFLATSFTAFKSVYGDGIHICALSKRRPDGTRRSKRAKQKEAQAMETLCFHQFRALASECGADDHYEAFQNLQQNEARGADLALWTYAAQLVQRSQFASQGPVVYRLWLQLPKETRQSLSAEFIWQARQRLLHFLQST